MQDVQSSIHDIDKAFQIFAQKEVAAWLDEGESNMSGSDLVRPSGSLKANLAHYLNQPSFNHIQTEQNETADPSNGCTAMVMANAYDSEQTIMFDHVHRRSEDSEAIENYPFRILALHEEFTGNILESLAAKVAIVYGAKVQKRILNDPKREFVVLPLWDWLDGIVLVLELESNFKNRIEGQAFRRALLFAKHPQRLFYEKKGSQLLINQDRITKAAVLMSNGSIEYRKDYYREREWPTQIPTGIRNAIAENGQQKCLHLPNTKHRKTENLSDQASLGLWADYFDSRPFSIAELRIILPAALSACQEAQLEGQQWDGPEQFPSPIAHWFRGQKHTLFRETWPNTVTDIRKQLCRIARIDERSSSLVTIICTILTLQLTKLQTLQLKYKTLNSHENLWYFGLEEPVQLACSTCGKQSQGKDIAIWAVNAPDHFVARKRYCRSSECGVKQKWFIPRNELWLPASVNILNNPDLASIPHWTLCVRSPDDTQGLPQGVSVFCLKCKENTKTIDDKPSYFRTNLQWTVGQHPLFIEQDLICKNCDGYTRFIPVDEAIPSILRKNLSNIVKRWGGCGQLIIGMILDTWSPSQRVYRYSK